MLNAKINNGFVEIRVAVEELSEVIEGAWASGGIDTRWKVTDTDVFAKDLVRALNAEEGDGTTMVHRLFDKAIDEALEQGAEGIEVHENQEG